MSRLSVQAPRAVAMIRPHHFTPIQSLRQKMLFRRAMKSASPMIWPLWHIKKSRVRRGASLMPCAHAVKLIVASARRGGAQQRNRPLSSRQ